MTERLLITPLGTSPGVLYTLVKVLQPDRIFVVSSAKALGSLPEIAQRSGFDLKGIVSFFFQDPFSGFEEMPGFLEALKKNWPDAVMPEVIVNLAGGTSFLQYAVGKASDFCEQKKIPVKKVFAVDRREFSQQREEPYVVGEVIPVP
ncbi:MAG TPA: hypothetical protein P5560_00925 [Thermotogota bacterium]|nr:hypothetical protein [Thermotogota bacterium]HRW91490.1 hypothetical protein [Thermotogota bacterium]